MIIEAITIAAILGGSAVATLLAKSKFQPEIEGSLTKTNAEKAIVASQKSH